MQGYFSLSHENRRKLLLVLAREYDLNRAQVRELIKQYLGLELPSGEILVNYLSNCALYILYNYVERNLTGNILVSGDKALGSGSEEGGLFPSFYRIERNLRHALKPVYEVLFDRLNTHPGGLRFLSILRADTLSILT